MAAGLGFKDFVTGEVLTAADVDGYLMQGVWVFASAAARDAAVTSPQEGNFAYLKDTNVTTYYTGSAWANLDTTGMTNPMTTTGDTIYSSSGSTPARLGIGSTGQVLTVAGGVPSWATPSTPTSKVVQIVNATYSTTTTIAAGVTTTTGLTASITPTSASNKVLVFFSQTAGTSGSGYLNGFYLQRGTTTIGNSYGGEYLYNNGISYIVPGGLSGSYLDSPATTSATSYRTVAAVSGGGGSVGINWNGSQATMTLMEVTP
jgi:hypothetical protein